MLSSPYFAQAWFGPQATVSPLHHDPYHNLLAQVVGSKYVRLYDPAFSDALYPDPDPSSKNTSRVELELELQRQRSEGGGESGRFPLFAAAPYTECILGPGEMLYIPPGWWHYVRSLSVSFSVSFWWECNPE